MDPNIDQSLKLHRIKDFPPLTEEQEKAILLKLTTLYGILDSIGSSFRETAMIDGFRTALQCIGYDWSRRCICGEFSVIGQYCKKCANELMGFPSW